MKLDIDAFKILDVIIQESSFANAAEKLHKTQSAVSYQIKKLENHLGITIFDRNGYRAELTPVGKVLWGEGLRMLQLASRIETLSEHYSTGWEPKLELVIDGALPTIPVMKALKVMTSQAVPTRIQVKTEFLGGVQMRFESDHSDMMLVADYKPSPNLKAIPLPPKTMMLVAASEHILATLHNIELSQLYEHVELTIHDSSDTDKQKLDTLQFGGDRVFFLNDFLNKKNALLMGLGFGWMPELFIRDELASGALQELDYQGGSRVSLAPQLVYPSDRPLGKAGKLLSELIMNEFSE